jgi:DNA-binding response OmpR family regulator
VTKPFKGPELLARIRARLRRTAPRSDGVHLVGDLEIDAAAYRVHKRWREVTSRRWSSDYPSCSAKTPVMY